MPAAAETLHVRINPDNRRVDTLDPLYLDQWVRSFQGIRDEREEELSVAYRDGSLDVPVLDGPGLDSPEKVIHFWAHSDAEAAMQRWAVLGGIGLVGGDSVYDHGQTVIYHEDPVVPLYGHIIMDSPEAA